MQSVAILAVIMSVPIVAIVSNALLKMKRMQLEQNQQPTLEELEIVAGSITKLKQENDALHREVNALQQRVDQLERRLPQG